MWLFALFLGVPLIEIALFIQVGGAIGLFPTLIIVVLTAIMGTYLVRQQGIETLKSVQNSFETLNDPTEPLVHGAMILFAGALLLTPGFFTDLIGFLLLTPAFRVWSFSQIKQRSNHRHGQFKMRYKNSTTKKSNVYEGEFKDVTPNENSPWGDGSKHND